MVVLKTRSAARIIIELAVVVIVGLFATREFQTSSRSLVLRGWEAEWLTSSAYLAADTLRSEGYLPLWQPYLGRGEPAIESPFSFVLNPISTAPSLIFGAEDGIKYSVVLYAIFAGVGGWLLGCVLGLGSLGRLLLALLCIGRGNMHEVIYRGYFQLGVTQAYFPWIAAATLAIIRFHRSRAPVVLLAIMLTLLFWAGNIYYMLPALIMVAVMTLVFLIRHRQIDRALVRRIGLALLLTVGLAAVTLLPIFAHQSYIGGHANEDPTAEYEPLATAAAQFFLPQRYYSLTTWQETYYSYTVPVWFAGLIFVLLPPIHPALQRSADPRLRRRVLIAALFMIGFFLLWGTGTNPIIRWAYANLPLIGQWRVLSRMLTVSAFWVAVLVALRVDGLWRAAVLSRRWNQYVRVPKLHLVVGVALILACAVAARQVLDTWHESSGVKQIDFHTSVCVEWLRLTYPDDYLAVYGRDYYTIYAYIRNRVRFTHINADYRPLGMPSTLFDGDLSSAPPEFLLTFANADRTYWFQRGYRLLAPSLVFFGRAPCLMRNPNTLSYAFTILRRRLGYQTDTLDPTLTTPITALNRKPDHIGLIVSGDPYEESVVVVQELAWPGWNVTVDGLPAKLESVGQLIGVILPKGNIPHQILFVYDPPLLKIGGLVTLATAAVCGMYLLKADRFVQ